MSKSHKRRSKRISKRISKSKKRSKVVRSRKSNLNNNRKLKLIKIIKSPN